MNDCDREWIREMKNTCTICHELLRKGEDIVRDPYTTSRAIARRCHRNCLNAQDAYVDYLK